MDGGRKGCVELPLRSRRGASLDAIAAFITGEVDDARLDALIWGLVLVNHGSQPKIDHWRSGDAARIPRVYALLKLLFLPHPITLPTGEVTVRPEPALTTLLRAERIPEACEIGLRRLRSSGLVPMTSRRGGQPAGGADWWHNDIDPRRLAAALVFPISKYDTARLMDLVIRPGKTDNVAVA